MQVSHVNVYEFTIFGMNHRFSAIVNLLLLLFTRNLKLGPK